jgi:maltooligosyltrehalose trehalohydrolase
MQRNASSVDKPLCEICERLPVGEEMQPVGGVHFRVWAPDKKLIAILIEDVVSRVREIELMPEEAGYFSGEARDAGAGTLYRYHPGGWIGPKVFP